MEAQNGIYVDGKKDSITYVHISEGMIVGGGVIPRKSVRDNSDLGKILGIYTPVKGVNISGPFPVYPLTEEDKALLGNSIPFVNEAIGEIEPMGPRDIPEYIGSIFRRPNSRLNKVMRKEGKRTGMHHNYRPTLEFDKRSGKYILKNLKGTPKHLKRLSVCCDKVYGHLVDKYSRCRGKVERTVKNIFGNQEPEKNQLKNEPLEEMV